MLLQPFCLLPELHRGIMELFNYLKDRYRVFQLSFLTEGAFAKSC